MWYVHLQDIMQLRSDLQSQKLLAQAADLSAAHHQEEVAVMRAKLMQRDRQLAVQDRNIMIMLK